MRLIQKVKKNLQDNPLFVRGATVIVGTSGGPDSTALTHILHNLQYELGFHLHIAHFNHNLHRSANTDQKFVEQLAEQLNVPCSVGHWSNSKTHKKGSIEDAARKQRFQFFNQLAKKINARVIVLAHTEDDLAETVLMRVLRGTGLQGLRGILPSRKMDGIYYIRPLLAVKKEHILTFLKKKNIPYRIDPTNKKTEFFRNKIRLELLPLLSKQYNHNIKELLTNLADNIATDYNYLEMQAQKLFTKLAKCSSNNKNIRIDLKLYSSQHPALKRMIIRNGVKQLRGNTNRLTLAHFREIEDFLQNRPQKATVHLPRNISIRKDSKYLIMAQN
jgi:tRNA(Ile)-lysidine synthase